MNGFALLVATAVMGVDYGWQPDADGQLEYIIQIEPMTLIALREGHDVVSQIDPYVRNVGRFRIRVGTEPVPRRGLPPREPTEAASSPAPPGVEYGWQVVDQYQIEFIVQISPDRLEKLHGGEEINGQIPSGLRDVARLRVRSGTGVVPREKLPVVTNGVSNAGAAGAERPAPIIPEPSIAEHSHEWSQLWAMAAPRCDWRVDPRDRGARQCCRIPRTHSRASGVQCGPRYGQLDSRYQSLTDMPKDNLRPRETPRDEIPLTSLPLPRLGGSQTRESFQPRTIERGSSVYDQRTQGWAPPNQGSNTTADAPRRMDASQPAAPPVAYSQSPRTEFSPQAPYPATSPAYPWPGGSDTARDANSLASRSRTLISDSVAAEDDRQYFGIPDTLASALGYEPWPNRVVSYDVEVTPSPASQDFWSSLSETANDRSLDYLREEEEGDKPWWPLTLAALALFASMGGNLYMGWIVAGTYRKYLDLADDLNDGDHRESAADDREDDDDWSPRRSRRERRTVDV